VAGYENQILLGDLNSISLDDDYELETLQVEPRFDVTNMLNQDYVDIASYLELDDKITHPTASNKHPDYTMPIRIDYIFVTPSLAPRVKDLAVIKTETSEQASDHYPMIATIE
jgi:endonuclease/exonuclease/phosphatase family metal-dependent hydrolase